MLCVNPLVPIPVAQALLGKDEDEIIEAVEDGLLVGWNLGLGTHRRETRILYPSLVWYATLQNVFPADPNAIAESLFAPGVPITTVTLRQTLSCGAHHLGDLIRAGHLRLMPGSVLRRGPGGEGTVERQSCISFLKSRLI